MGDGVVGGGGRATESCRVEGGGRGAGDGVVEGGGGRRSRGGWGAGDGVVGAVGGAHALRRELLAATSGVLSMQFWRWGAAAPFDALRRPFLAVAVKEERRRRRERPALASPCRRK